MIGVVVLNYNGASLTCNLVEKINNYDSVKKIIIVDNHSTDNSLLVIKKHFSKKHKVEILLSDKNGGYSSGNNLGLKWLAEQSNCKTAIVCNPDVLFDEDFVQKLDRALIDNKSYGLLTGIMLDPDGTITKNQFWDLPTFLEDFSKGFFIFNFLIKKNNLGLKMTKENTILECVPAGSVEAVNLDYMREVDFFDESVFLFYEENILAKKLKEKKYKTGILLSSNYYHYHSQIINSTVKLMKKYKIYQESMYYYQVNYNKINLIQKGLLKVSMFMGRILFFFKNYKRW